MVNKAIGGTNAGTFGTCLERLVPQVGGGWHCGSVVVVVVCVWVQGGRQQALAQAGRWPSRRSEPGPPACPQPACPTPMFFSCFFFDFLPSNSCCLFYYCRMPT
jgi:hypothetical protein